MSSLFTSPSFPYVSSLPLLSPSCSLVCWSPKSCPGALLSHEEDCMLHLGDSRCTHSHTHTQTHTLTYTHTQTHERTHKHTHKHITLVLFTYQSGNWLCDRGMQEGEIAGGNKAGGPVGSGNTSLISPAAYSSLGWGLYSSVCLQDAWDERGRVRPWVPTPDYSSPCSSCPKFYIQLKTWYLLARWPALVACTIMMIACVWVSELSALVVILYRLQMMTPFSWPYVHMHCIWVLVSVCQCVVCLSASLSTGWWWWRWHGRSMACCELFHVLYLAVYVGH